MKHPNLKHCRPLRSGEKIRSGDMFNLDFWIGAKKVAEVPAAWIGDRYHRIVHPQVYRKKGK